MRHAWIACLVLGLSGFGCSKNEGRSTIRKGADDVESEIKHAPQSLSHGADDVDESARGLIGAGGHDEPAATPAKAEAKTDAKTDASKPDQAAAPAAEPGAASSAP